MLTKPIQETQRNTTKSVGEEENGAQFCASSSRLGGKSPIRTAKVRLTMIVKNEQGNNAACLESVRGLFDEIVVVDTGSTDRTRRLPASSGAGV